MKIRLLAFPILFFVLWSCKPSQDKNRLGHLRKNVEYAIGFDFEDFGSTVKVNIYDNDRGAGHVETYWLVHDNMEVKGDNVIHVPIKRAVCMSSTHVGYISELLSDSIIVGISGTQFVSNPIIYSRAEQGRIAEVGYNQTLNYELLCSLKPDVVFMFNVRGEALSYISKMKELGLKVVNVPDFLENNPLGRAEWIKFFSLFLDKREVADSVFNAVKKGYNRYKLIANSETSHKTVFLNLPFRDIWYFPGVDSYFVKLIIDAAGNYCFPDLEGFASHPLSTEVAYKVGLSSDVWLNTGTAQSLKDIEEIDKRFTNFKPYKEHQVYNNTKRMGNGGGNDFWEYGAVHPELILRDLIKILHPHLLPADSLFFYKKLE